MCDHMDRNMVLFGFCGVEYAPISGSQFVKLYQGACQCFGLHFIEMFSKPFDLFYDSFCDRKIKLRKVFESLRRKFNVIFQERFNLSLTSRREIRPFELNESWSLALISSESSRN